MALTQTEVSQLYVSLLGRASEGEGNSYWQQFDSVQSVISMMLDLDVVQEYFGTTLEDNQAFIEFIYENTLNKTIEDDPEGVAYWVTLLESSEKTKPEVIEGLIAACLDENNVGDAQNQFINRVEVSNYTAQTVLELPEAYQSVLSFNEDLVVTSDSATVDEAKNTLYSLVTSSTATILSIEVNEGYFTFGSQIYIDVIFNDDIYIDGVDCELQIQVSEDVFRTAKIYAYDSNSLTFVYDVEDGYFAQESTLHLPNSAFILNNTTIKDKDGLNADLNNDSYTNENTIIVDTKGPVYAIDNINYNSMTNSLFIYGEGFSSILEYNEDNSIDISERIDFTKLTWDIDSDDNGTTNTIYSFSGTDVLMSKVNSDGLLEVVFNNEMTLESLVNYGDDGGSDSIDVASGFLLDTAGNISTNEGIDNIILGIDGVINGNQEDNILYGSKGDDTISGNEGDNQLFGLQGNDTIIGGTGNDYIVGGKGIDILSGGLGQNTYSFASGDSLPLFETYFGVDKITGLVLNSDQGDFIDLDIEVDAFNVSVTGNASQATFIDDINQLVSIDSVGFNVSVQNDIAACIIIIDEGDLVGKQYLAVDLNASDSFDTEDFIIDVTGGSFIEINAEVFI